MKKLHLRKDDSGSKGLEFKLRYSTSHPLSRIKAKRDKFLEYNLAAVCILNASLFTVPAPHIQGFGLHLGLSLNSITFQFVTLGE